MIPRHREPELQEELERAEREADARTTLIVFLLAAALLAWWWL